MQKIFYKCPQTGEALEPSKSGLLSNDGILYPYLEGSKIKDIPVFLSSNSSSDGNNVLLNSYETAEAVEQYKNYIDWLFETFAEEQDAVRVSMLSKLKLKSGDRILVTGCGLGEDLVHIARLVGRDGEIHCQDLSSSMVAFAAEYVTRHKNNAEFCKIQFSVGNALNLPFEQNVFDAAFHFGGINLFGDIQKAIKEMARVVKTKGKVAFGDEGVAPWLVESEYGKIAINNNQLWTNHAPLESIPAEALDVNVTWILGNCFYLIDFTVSDSGPRMNIDIPHKSPRGGTARSRYFGQVEGVHPKTKLKIAEAAKKENTSIHEWLEKTIKKSLR